MGVRERIYDAKVLWEAGREEGAVIHVLIAFAATVRKRYPMPLEDSLAFKAFILEEMHKITNGPYKGVAFYHDGNPRVSLETLIYNVVRCRLVHEGSLPPTIVFTKPVRGDTTSPRQDGRPYAGNLFNRLELNDVTGFPIGWVWNLIRVVAEAPENENDFPDAKYPLPDGYSVFAGVQLSYPDEHPERFPPNAPPLGEDYWKEHCRLRLIIEKHNPDRFSSEPLPNDILPK